MLHLFVRLQAAWFLKMRALTEQTYVDEVEMDDEGIAELFMEDSVLADVASQCVQFLGHTHLSNWSVMQNSFPPKRGPAGQSACTPTVRRTVRV